MKSGSRENIYSLKGFGHVFRFTFLQTLKNKGFLVSAIMMILMMTFMRPLMYYMGKGGANAAQSLGDTLSNIEAEKMYILNETDIEMSRIDIAPEDAKPKEGTLNPDKVVLYGKSEANADELLGKLGAKEILVVIRPSATGYDVNAVIADTSDIQIKSMDHAVNYTRGIFESARKKQMKLDDQALKSINSGITKGGVHTVAEYADEKTHTMSKAELSGIAFGFSMLIMLVAALRPDDIAAIIPMSPAIVIIDSALRAAGFRTGRYTSPHLVSLNERFFLDGAPVSTEKLNAAMSRSIGYCLP